MPDPVFATAAELTAAVAGFDRHARRGVCVTPRYRLAYADWGAAGAGPPVVFVHGLSDQARSFALVMRKLVAAGLRCVAVELADGAGDGAVLGRYKHRHHADDVVCLLDHLGVPQADVFASSYGSTVALSGLIRHPARFRRAVLQGGFARRPLIAAERNLSRLARFCPGRVGDIPFRVRGAAKLDGPQFAGAAPEVYRFMLQCSGRTPIRVVGLRALLLDTLDLRPGLPGVVAPVLMLGGDRDPVVPRHWEAEVEALVPGVRRVEFTPCGHYPQYTLPGPTAAETVAFLAPAAGGPPLDKSGPAAKIALATPARVAELADAPA